MKGAPACLVGRRLHWLLKQEIDTLFKAEIPPLGMSPLRSISPPAVTVLPPHPSPSLDSSSMVQIGAALGLCTPGYRDGRLMQARPFEFFPRIFQIGAGGQKSSF